MKLRTELKRAYLDGTVDWLAMKALWIALLAHAAAITCGVLALVHQAVTCICAGTGVQ